MNELERALSSFLSAGEVAGQLARVLAHAAETGKVSYSETEKIAKTNPEDALLVGNEWRLLLPVRTFRSSAWEDRMFLAEPGEMYEVPNIVGFLVENAGRTGQWAPDDALSDLFRLAGDPEWERIPMLVDRLGKRSEDNKVNAVQIKEICCELGLGDRVDALIAELKGSGVMSPKLGSLSEVARAGSPIYELNPSLFTRKGGEE